MSNPRKAWLAQLVTREVIPLNLICGFQVKERSMKIPMIAYFGDEKARIVATVAAVAARKDVRLSVEGCMIVLGVPSEDPRNFILFFGGDEDKSFFVDNGAIFVGPLH